MSNDFQRAIDRVDWPRGVPRPTRAIVRMEHTVQHYGDGNGEGEAQQLGCTARVVRDGVCSGNGQGNSAMAALADAIVDYAARHGRQMDREDVLKRLRGPRRAKKRQSP